MTPPAWFKPALLGAGAGAIALAIIGFSVGGWVTGSTANKLAAARASTETVDALLPYCVARSEMDPNSTAIITRIVGARTFERDDIVMEAGWATAPGDDNRPDRDLAEKCAASIVTAAS